MADATGNANVDLTVTANLNNGEASVGGVIKEGAGLMNLGSSDFSGPAHGEQRLAEPQRHRAQYFRHHRQCRRDAGNRSHQHVCRRPRLGGSQLESHHRDRWHLVDEWQHGQPDWQRDSPKRRTTWTSNRALTGYDVLLGNTSTGVATVSVSNTGGRSTASIMNGSGGIHLGGVQNFDVADVTGNSTADLTVSMVLDNGGSQGGTGGINKTGPGTMAITTNATFYRRHHHQWRHLEIERRWRFHRNDPRRGDRQQRGLSNSRPTMPRDIPRAQTGFRAVTINTGGTVHVSTTGGGGQNQTVSNCAITLNGGAITGVAGSTFHLFNNGTSINTTASVTPSTISGIKLGLRQNDTQFNIADGAAATDLEISAVIENGATEGNHDLVKMATAPSS